MDSVINDKTFNRDEPIFGLSFQENNDKKIEEVIKATSNMRIATSLIPFFASDELRKKYMREYSESITDTSESKTKAYSISSIVFEPLKIEEMINAYNGKVSECGEELAIVTASFESMRLKLKLMEMLLHRRNQGIVMASLPECDETKEIVKRWGKDNHYSEETIAKELEQGRKKLYNVSRKESKDSFLDFATGLDLLSRRFTSREKYEILDSLIRPNVFGEKRTLKTISDIDPEQFELLCGMMEQMGKSPKDCLRIRSEYNNGIIDQKEADVESVRKEVTTKRTGSKGDLVPGQP